VDVALPKIELFRSLKKVIAEYPCQPTLQQGLLDFLYDLLKTSLPCDAGAVRLLADRFLTPGLHGEGLVEGLRRANEVMMESIGHGSQEDVMQEYVAFVEEWCRTSMDENLVGLLLRSRFCTDMFAENLSCLLDGVTDCSRRGGKVNGV
jgi:U3 small nucleolar RNA-associated protein 6